jgi:hypothetical protein
MDIRKKINTVACFDCELDLIEYNIALLHAMAQSVIDLDVDNVDMILETLPNNGTRAIISPLYPQTNLPTLNPVEDNIPIQPIGYQRWYDPKEIDEKQGCLTVMVEMNRNIILPVIDIAVLRLKKRKSEILKTSRNLIKTD